MKRLRKKKKKKKKTSRALTGKVGLLEGGGRQERG